MNTSPASIGDFACNAVVDPDKKALVDQIRDLVKGLSPQGRFPGPNPCSLERADLTRIQSGDNWLCEKTDGIRVLLVFVVYQGTNVACLVTRAWDVYVVGVRKCPKVLFQGTLFDGELVNIGGQWTWLGFDAVMVCGIPVHSLPLSQRLRAAEKSLVDYARHPSDRMAIEFKKYFRVFSEYAHHLRHTKHPVDGTIVTPEDAPVVLGRHVALYKLKDSQKHTVDFEFQGPDVLRVYDPERRASVPVATLAPVPAHLRPGCILEASWVTATTWDMVLVREDKTTSNDMLTYTKTLVNIRENLGLADLEAHWRV